jgi:hypothetical protein
MYEGGSHRWRDAGHEGCNIICGIQILHMYSILTKHPTFISRLRPSRPTCKKVVSKYSCTAAWFTYRGVCGSLP